jgi:hypothetical protein
MKALKELLNQYYPEENVVSEREVQFKTSFNSFFGGRMTHISNSGELAIPMIETDTKLFFDVRPIFRSTKPYKKQLKSLTYQIYIALFAVLFILFGYRWLTSIANTSVSFMILCFAMLGIFVPIILKFNSTEANILAIDKSWITDTRKEEGATHVTWTLPQDAYMGFSFVNLLSEDKKKELPLMERFKSGEFLPFAKKFGSVFGFNTNDVIFSYREPPTVES